LLNGTGEWLTLGLGMCAQAVLRVAPMCGGKFYSYNEWFIGDSFSLWGTPSPWGTFRTSLSGS
jgi:hypothetical protein